MRCLWLFQLVVGRSILGRPEVVEISSTVGFCGFFCGTELLNVCTYYVEMHNINLYIYICMHIVMHHILYSYMYTLCIYSCFIYIIEYTGSYVYIFTYIYTHIYDLKLIGDSCHLSRQVYGGCSFPFELCFSGGQKQLLGSGLSCLLRAFPLVILPFGLSSRGHLWTLPLCSSLLSPSGSSACSRGFRASDHLPHKPVPA